MMATLTPDQISHVLQMQIVGRIGITGEKAPYVVPVSYAFDGKDIYAHSKEGLKIEMMRKNPDVCFQVDVIDSINIWRSVLVYGQYKELKKQADIAHATKLLHDRFAPMLLSDVTKQPGKTSNPPAVVEKSQKAIFFVIKISEMTGRFELGR